MFLFFLFKDLKKKIQFLSFSYFYSHRRLMSVYHQNMLIVCAFLCRVLNFCFWFPFKFRCETVFFSTNLLEIFCYTFFLNMYYDVHIIDAGKLFCARSRDPWNFLKLTSPFSVLSKLIFEYFICVLLKILCQKTAFIRTVEGVCLFFA